MTRCPFDPEVLSARVDGELDSAERERFESHLPCGDCESRLATLGATKRALSTLPGRLEPSDALRARVEALRFRRSPRAERLDRRVRRHALLVACVAALSAGALIAAWRLRASAGSEEHTAELLVSDHLRSVPEVRPAEVSSGDPATVERFFAGHVDFSPKAPTLPGARLLGGRLCRVEGQLTELLFYQREERVLSLYVAGDSLGVDGCRKALEHEVCSTRRGGVTLTLVGLLPRAELERLLAEARL